MLLLFRGRNTPWEVRSIETAIMHQVLSCIRSTPPSADRGSTSPRTTRCPLVVGNYIRLPVPVSGTRRGLDWIGALKGLPSTVPSIFIPRSSLLIIRRRRPSM